MRQERRRSQAGDCEFQAGDSCAYIVKVNNTRGKLMVEMNGALREDGLAASPHIPVLSEHVIANLPESRNGTFIDVTLGYGGHAAAIIASLESGSRFIGMDKDEAALAYASRRLEPLARAKNVEFMTYKRDFADFAAWYAANPYPDIKFILADIGVSSPQLDQPERGFSYKTAGPLDMRMDRSAVLDCQTLIAQSTERELSDIIYRYGEERYARQIAAAIVAAREQAPLRDTLTLAEVIRRAMPKKALHEKQDPARRTFQALRIAVNDELGALEKLLQSSIDALAQGGRLALISFHSLEDRIVKKQFNAWQNPCRCLPDLPCQCGLQAQGRVIGKHGFTANDEENKNNFRAHSARLRVFEKA